MHAGRQYSLKKFIIWTRRDIYRTDYSLHYSNGIVPGAALDLACHTVGAYALIGTAAAFIVGFRNNATYSRLWEARQIYGAIVNLSRTWGIMARDFVTAPRDKSIASETAYQVHRELIYRHIAWLTAMRFSATGTAQLGRI